MIFGGRTSVQKQSSGINFNRNWQDYTDGFGTPGGDHWLGLEKMKAISDKTPSKFVVRLAYNNAPAWRQIICQYFSLSDAVSGFRINFTGTTTPQKDQNRLQDVMTDLRGARFSTYDRDNDEKRAGSCAQTHKSEFQDKSFAFSCVGRCASSSTCEATNVVFAEKKCYEYTLEEVENITDFKDVLYQKMVPPVPECQNGGKWSDPTNTSCDCTGSFTGTYCERYWDDCSEGYRMNILTDGIYTIQPRPYGTPFEVYCFMKFGGRTSVQKQSSGINFNRNWQRYADGFGTPGGDHWLGLEKMKAISDKTPSKLVVRLVYKKGTPTWGQIICHFFGLSDAVSGFKINFTHITTPANPLNRLTDVMTDLRGAKFSTYNRDNDENAAGSCAQTHKSGWWFRNCTGCNPNGILKPVPNRAKDPDDIFWEGDTRGVKETTMYLGGY
ncbi:uncharacterized protein [Haliotis asinina]|uniref:uncharacterized protein n=1 Tax=Haliotis asinina TaxID=109174 RepID=UPI00353215DB